MDTQESYPGVHALPVEERNAVLNIATMPWQKVSGKVVGVEDKTLADKNENPGNLWTSLARLLPGGVFPEHRHPYPQLFFFTEGSGVVELDSKPIHVQPGMAVRMFHGESHKVINNTDKDLVLIQISLPLWRPSKVDES